ncbi:hypothetical protein ACFX2C_005438 [Malus domestica]
MYKSSLEELCRQRRWRLPEYSTTRDGPNYAPWFYAPVTVNGFDFRTGNAFGSANEAQNEAAKDALDHLSKPSNPIPGPSSFPQPCLPSSSSAPYWSDMQHLSKSQLESFAQKRNLHPPVYSCEMVGPPHNRRFKCKVTIGGQTFEGQEFLPTLKDAERAVAKVALMSVLPNGVQEDHSGLFKNLLQELGQKGFSRPVYSSRISGDPHVPVFVSFVEMGGERFMGEEASSGKQAELNALPKWPIIP